MQRAIQSFSRDAAGDWIAELSCGHRQHARHDPPFWLRPWVLTAEGRDGMLGVELPCSACDRLETPDG